MMSSCTLLSLAPPAAPGKFSPAALPLRIKQPAAASSSAAALPSAAPHKASRARPLVCHATYDILPNALVHPPVSGGHDNWSISEDHKGHIILMFDVGTETKGGDLKVTTTKDQDLNVWLLIKYPATSLDARLQMPPGCDKDNVMTAEILRDGWLLIVIAKPKQENKDIKVTNKREQVVTEETSSPSSKMPPQQAS